jgi:hypothetical protein
LLRSALLCQASLRSALLGIAPLGFVPLGITPLGIDLLCSASLHLVSNLSARHCSAWYHSVRDHDFICFFTHFKIQMKFPKEEQKVQWAILEVIMATI